MKNTIITPMFFLALVLLVFMPLSSTAWGYQDNRDHGRPNHGHGFHFYPNSDLTLVSGMDTIDSRVLVDPAPDPTPEVIDEPAPQPPAPVPSQIIRPDAEGNYIVSIPNNTGGFTPIRIQKFGNGFVGPQGEFYYPFPEVSQLKAMYGL